MAVFQIRSHPCPVISVIIPSRDGYAHGNVPRLVAQLERQERIEEAEILLVVGESPNGHARNVGVNEARGRWLVFMDDDAGLRGQRILVELLAPLERSERGEIPPLGMTGSATAMPAEASRFQQRVAAALPRALFPEVAELTHTDMAHHLCCALPARVYQQIGRESDTLETGTDVDLRERLRAAGFGIAVVPRTVATHPQPTSLGELWRKHLWYGCGRVELDRLHPGPGRNRLQGGRFAVVIYLARAVATAPLRILRYDRSTPWGWNPLRALTDLAQKVGHGRAYWRHLHGLGPRPEPLFSSRRMQAWLSRRVGQPPQAPAAASIRRMLVVLTAGLGDAVTFLPTLRALREACPQARITVWTSRAATAAVLKSQGAADTVVRRSLESATCGGRIWRKLTTLAWLRRQRFDLAVVNFINSNEETGALLYLGGVRHRLGYVDDPAHPGLFDLPVRRPPLLAGVLAGQRHLHLLDRLGIPRPVPGVPIWAVSPSARSRAAELVGHGNNGRPVVGIHPGCGAQMSWKRWPVERFAALADGLTAAGAEVWLFGGPDEEGLAAELRARAAAPLRDWTGKGDLDLQAALMSRCDLFVANDSGLYNLALALPLPVVSIFGPTLPAHSGPWPRSQAAEVVARDMVCRPCVDLLMPPRQIRCPIGMACLTAIGVDQVLAACRRLLAKPATAGAAGMTLPVAFGSRPGAGGGP
jgi:ADP-heptose:LPS heptosyltransferase/GT2 family glycosyltransferase